MRERLGKWRPLIGYIGKLETSDWLDWAYRQCVYVVCTVRTVEEVEISSTSSMKAVRRTTQPIAFPAQVTKLQPPRITSRQAYGIIGRTLVASLAACLGSTNATHEQPQRTIATHVYQGLAACQLSANR